MHDYPGIILTALLILLFGLFSRLAERSPITGPMFFVGVGLLISPLGFDLFNAKPNTTVVKIVAETTLILILFVDATMIRSAHLGKVLAGLPARLLVLGLPLTMLLGIVVANVLFPSMDLWLIVLVALILSPTDAALGLAVITSPKVPIKIREALSIESGLNDGIVLPLVLMCIAILVEGSQTVDGSGRWAIFMVKQLTIAPLVGGLIGWGGGYLVDRAATAGWMKDAFQRLSALSLALLAFAGAELLQGNGFIAAFFAGLMLGVKTPVVRERIQEFGEAEGQLLSLFIFLIFGLVMVPIVADVWNAWTLFYALLSLTVIRMLPVAISLAGSGLNYYDVGFIGWFGPRGIASILYLLIAAGELGVVGYIEAYSIIVLTVLISTFAHGSSALVLTKHYKI
ncbi:MAG: cation:proton antiporter [Porticoccus sp.]